MPELIESVPNFSEGRDRTIIDKVTGSVEAVAGVRVLSVESDPDYNRSVLSFVGDSESIANGAFECARACLENIDMTGHKGEHPRLGAVDVVPFIPVRGIDMDGAVSIAHSVGKRIASELDVPVYMYGKAAVRPGYANLATVRRGEYEGLAERMSDPDRVPDYGPARFVPRFGAAIVGARPFLVAYNVNLATDDVKAADRIARRVRTSGYKKDGERVPGLLAEVKGLGVWLDRYNIAQVSMNLTDFKVTSMHKAFDTVAQEAGKLGIEVDGSELIGLAPLDALRDAAIHAGADPGDAPIDLVRRAVEYLGLDRLYGFDPDKKILEFMLEDEK